MWLPSRVSGISGWREQVMAFWRALIYTPPFLSLSSVKRWERWGAASSHSCELHLPGVRGSIVNSDLVPSTMPNYYQHHVIYTSVAGENIALEAVTEQSCAAAVRERAKRCAFMMNIDLRLIQSTCCCCCCLFVVWKRGSYHLSQFTAGFYHLVRANFLQLWTKKLFASFWLQFI